MRAMFTSSIRAAALLSLFIATGAVGQENDDDFNPLTVAVEDAINCHIDARTYNGFAWQLDDKEVGWRARGWTQIKGRNPFLSEYRLPQPIEIAGMTTSHVALNASGIFVVLALPDPTALAASEKIPNQADSGEVYSALGVPDGIAATLPKTHRFLGERVLVDEREKDEKLNLVFHTRIKRTMSTVSSHPGKTLYGCDYKIEMEEPEAAKAESSAAIP
jgi:hypothetical protein